MPYIICVNQPGCLPESDPIAVATVEEARTAAEEEVYRAEGPLESEYDVQAIQPRYAEARAMPESGGAIGPLPDGYVIEVRPVCWNWIIGQAEDAGIDTQAIHDDAPGGKGDLAILDAYNQQ